jgi:hypothetical protein
MNYRKTIAEAWDYTRSNKRLIFWLGVIPAFFTTTVSIGYMLYQFFAFKKSYLFSEHEESFLKEVAMMIITFLRDHFSWTLPLVIIAIVFAIIYFLLPTLAEAGAIQVIARNRNNQHASVSVGLRHGIMCFLRLLEYNLLVKTFTFFSIVIEMAFVLRNLGVGIFEIMLPIFILILIVSFVLMLLFTYTAYYIIIDGEGVLDSIKKSTRLVVVNWRDTFLITFLMVLIGIRIIIQAFLVFLVPIAVVGVTGYLTTILLPATSIILGCILGFIALLVAAYINGVVNIFSYTVWTFTFLKITSEKEISARDKMEKVGTVVSAFPKHTGV